MVSFQLPEAHSPLQKAATTAFFIWIVNFAVFAVVGMFLGGDAVNGRTVNGHYFLASHGKLTEVSKVVYIYSLCHTVITMSSFGLIALALIIARASKPKTS